MNKQSDFKRIFDKGLKKPQKFFSLYMFDSDEKIIMREFGMFGETFFALNNNNNISPFTDFEDEEFINTESEEPIALHEYSVGNIISGPVKEILSADVLSTNDGVVKRFVFTDIEDFKYILFIHNSTPINTTENDGKEFSVVIEDSQTFAEALEIANRNDRLTAFLAYFVQYCVSGNFGGITETSYDVLRELRLIKDNERIF